MSFAIDFIIDHPEDENKVPDSYMSPLPAPPTNSTIIKLIIPKSPSPTTNTDQQETKNVGSDKLKTKQEWVKRMRLKFSIRPEFEITQNILHSDGTLNQDYFRPPKGSIPQLLRKWTEKERALLIKGIQKYGIGHYKEISDEFLMEWSAQDLRVKTMRLIGRQNLQLYKDWKGDENAIKIEYEKNKDIGMKTGMWKAGTLVYDEKGVVLKMIQDEMQV